MLTGYDDYPVHQLGQPFDSCATADPRFFDRYWFVAYDPAGEAQIASGLGVYRNMNVLDGFGAVLLGSVQHNVRVSRRLRPDFDTIGAGPLRYEVVEGLKSFRLGLAENAYGTSFNLHWVAEHPAFEEPHHRRFIDGLLHEDYRRFYQFGRVTGHVTVDGRTIDLGDGWFGFRDRSFGVRPGVGGPGVKTPPPAARQGREMTFIAGVGFATDDMYGSFHVQEDDEGNVLYATGAVLRHEGGEWVQHVVEDIVPDVAFGDSRRLKSLAFDFAAGARKHRFEGIPLGAPFAYQGYGYMDGYWDKAGLGAWRGEDVIEGERYDMSDPANVVDLGGRRTFPPVMPLEYPLRVVIDGTHAGFADSMVGIVGKHPRYNP